MTVVVPLLLLFLVACTRDDASSQAGDVSSLEVTERALVIDVPLEDDALGDGSVRTAPMAPSVGVVEASEALSPYRTPPKGSPPLSVGDIVVLAPVVCGAVSVSDADGPGTCDPAMLRSGFVDDRQFVSTLTFDLAGLPPGSEVLYGALELTGLDDEFVADYGRWYIRMVDLPADVPAEDLTFSDVVEAPASDPGGAWRLRANEIEARGVNTLEFGTEIQDELAVRLGSGSITFRIEGPSGRTNMFSWPADGPDAPRLRVGYVAMPAADEDEEPLVIWDDK